MADSFMGPIMRCWPIAGEHDTYAPNRLVFLSGRERQASIR